MKQCKRCQQWKLFPQFHEHRKRGKYGPYYRSTCRQCVADVAREKFANDEAYRSARVASRRREQQKNRDKYRARRRKYYLKNREAVLKKARLRTADERRPSRQKYYAKHREAIVAKACEHMHRRREYKQSGSGLTLAEWREILEAHGHRCAYCGAADKKLTRDHIVPLSRGGLHEPANIVPACKSCNSGKNNKLPDEWWRAKESQRAQSA